MLFHARRAALLALCSFAAPLLSSSVATAGPAVDQFEIKSLEIEQGEVEVEVQSDYAMGFPRRKFVDDGTGPEFDDNEVARQRHEAEISLGLTDWLKIGVGLEWEQERIDDPDSFADAQEVGDLELTEASIGAQVAIIPIKGNGIGLGAYTELQLARAGEEPNLAFFGSILQAVQGPWSATANLAVIKYFNGTPEDGEKRDEKLDFAYFTQIKYDFSQQWALAVEAYGTIDRLGDTGHASDTAIEIGDQDQHRIGPVVYYSFNTGSGSAVKAQADDDAGAGDDDDNEGTGVTVSAGVLFGLNDDTPDTTLKTGLEIEF